MTHSSRARRADTVAHVRVSRGPRPPHGGLVVHAQADTPLDRSRGVVNETMVV